MSDYAHMTGDAAPVWPTVDEFAQHIRWLNGSNKMGAASLAEKLLVWLQSRNAGAMGAPAPDEDLPPGCECDNTHQSNDTVCRWCWAHGRRRWNDPDVPTGVDSVHGGKP